MAKRRRTRRRNPSWLVTAGLSTVALVVGAGIAVAYARRGNGVGGRVFYYWVEQQGTSDFGFPQYVPYIQQASSGEIFALPMESSQGAASQAARAEIFIRGGEAQEGKPVTSNPALVGQVKPQGYAEGDEFWIHSLDYDAAAPWVWMDPLHAFSPNMTWGGTVSLHVRCFAIGLGCSEYNPGGTYAFEVKENGHVGGQWYTCRWTRGADPGADWTFQGCTVLTNVGGGGMSKQHPGGGLYQEPKDEPLRPRRPLALTQNSPRRRNISLRASR